MSRRHNIKGEYLMDTTISARIEQASKILGLPQDQLRGRFVSSESINDDNLIQTVLSVSDSYDVINTIEHYSGKGIFTQAQLKAAVSILIGVTPDSQKPTISDDVSRKSSLLEELLRSQRPVQQWSDEELLQAYIDKDQEEYEYELNKRAKGRRFIVLADRDTEVIDVASTIRMLKRARKEDIPSHYQPPEGDLIHIYRIEDYHQSNRIRSESPLRPGVALFDDFCSVSNISFAGIDMNARRYLRIIHEAEGNMSRRDEKNIVEIARTEGIAGLIKEYPELNDIFMRKSMNDTLPTLKLVENVASAYVTKADPFKPSRHKQF